MRYAQLLTAILFLSLLCSCSVARKLPEGQYLLARNEVEVKKESDLRRKERVKPEEVSVYIKQKPNKRILGLKFSAWMYNLSNPEKSNLINRWLRRIGDPPVVYDSTLTLRSVDEISIYLRGRGFYDSHVEFAADTTRKKVVVKYDVETGMPARIGSVRYFWQDNFLEPIMRADSANTLLHAGDPFDVNVLQQERERITKYLKDQGYYTFNINNITYRADTTRTDSIPVTVVVRQHTAGHDASDAPIMENNAIYRIRNIYIQPDYNPDVEASDPDYAGKLDTVEYRGVYFIYYDKQNVKKDVLLRAVNIFPNYLYNETDINRAYDNVMRLDYFRNVRIRYSEVADSLSDNLITYIGDSTATQNFTRERYLDYTIQCMPEKKQRFSVDGELTTTSNYYGALMTLGYAHRNLFKGLELFEATLTGGYEYMRIKDRRNSFEIGGSVGLTLPRFMTPFKIDPYNKLINTRTHIEFAMNSQNRPYYRRVLSSGAFGYSWSNRKFSSFAVRPIDVSVVKMRSVDPDFLNTIQNPYLRNSYSSQLIAGISASYVYNNQLKNVNKNTFRIRMNAETNGNLLYGLSKLFAGDTSSEYHKLFGIQFAQYVRADVDASYRFRLGDKSGLVYRIYAGAGIHYGNSKNTNIPFERLFYGGGPNSMRAWQVRTLGPGSTPKPEESVYPTQLGNFKLETNLEFRFPVYGFLNGAVFTDVGNIWLVGRNIYTPEAKFNIHNFYKQLGVAAGLGARFDFNFFLIRVDWGMKIHDPNEPKDFRWIRNFTLRNSTFNFGIGYPF